MLSKNSMKSRWAPDINKGKVDIWDIDDLPKSYERNVLLLNSYAYLESASWISIPVLIEESAEKYRKRYLKFIKRTRVYLRSIRGYDLLCEIGRAHV